MLVQQINANSRQQFIIEEEEGAYSQRSSSEDQKPKSRQGATVNMMNHNDMNNLGSQNNLSSKGGKGSISQIQNGSKTYQNQDNKQPSRQGTRGFGVDGYQDGENDYDEAEATS